MQEIIIQTSFFITYSAIYFNKEATSLCKQISENFAPQSMVESNKDGRIDLASFMLSGHVGNIYTRLHAKTGV